MRKKVKQCIQRSLCGILSAAMILTSLSVPELSAYAAQPGGTEISEEMSAEEVWDEKVETESSSSAQETEEEQQTPQSTTEEEKESSETETREKSNVTETETEQEEKVTKKDTLERDNRANETGALQNGDFSSGKDSWTVTNLDITTSTETQMSGHDNYLYKWSNSDCDIEVSQEIQNVAAGKYTASIEAGGVYAAETFSLQVLDNDGSVLAEKKFEKSDAWGNWATVKTDLFEITDNSSIITIKVSGQLSSSNTDIHLDNAKFETLADGITLGALKTLITEAETKVQDDYTEDSWTAFDTALKAAQDLAALLNDKDDTYMDEEGATAITDAYNALNEAMEGLQQKIVSVTVDFSYYVGNTDGKGVGVYRWSENNNISSTAEMTSWELWGNKIYAMTPSEYKGWYTIPLTFTGSETDSANFQVMIEGNDTAIFKCGSTNDAGNQDIYTKFFNKENDNKQYAVKLFGENTKLYEGEDEVTAVLRDVTFYIYSAAGIPSLSLKETLKYVDDSNGDIINLTADHTDEWDNQYYDMKPDTQGNWYYLTFSIPVSKDIDLYVKDDAGAYTWKTKFTNGDNTSTDIMQTLQGAVYYKNGIFSDSRDITLGMLRDAVTEADQIKEQGNYTDETWKAFTEALAIAKNTADKYADEADTYTDQDNSTEIADAYKSLNTAMENLTEKGIGISFYYYAGDTNGKGVGIYQWSSNDNISSTAPIAEWKAWGTQPVYEMTPSGYSGWYTIPLTFKGSVEDDANFQVFVEGASDSVFKCGSEASKDNGGNSALYAKFFNKENDKKPYAVK